MLRVRYREFNSSITNLWLPGKLEIADRAKRLKKRLEILTSARDALPLDPEVVDRIEDERYLRINTLALPH